ncbi:MAG: ribosome recycling factor [Planctomycetes bacterium]|nr:ribosome recycling factor [Planctomycetota bacterium]
MSSKAVLDDGRGRFEKALTHLKDQLKKIRTGRASAALVDTIRVDYYGTPTPISQMAQVSIPEPRQILIKPFDASMLKELMKAVSQTDLGAAPQNDGKVLRITLPPLSGEQRLKYSAKVKEMCEEARVGMRNTRRDLNKHVDGMHADGGLTDDEHKKVQTQVQDLLKEYEKKVDETQKAKVTEIEQV